MSCTKGIHCGNKFAFHTSFKSFFINNVTTTTTTTKRKLTTTTTTTTLPPPQKVLDYNKLIKGHALKFKKNDAAQKEAIEILNEMKQKGIQPNSQTYLQLIIGMSFQRNRNNLQNERLQHWIDELLKLEKTKKEKEKSTLDKLKKIIFHLSFRGHPNLKHIFLQIIQDFQVVDLDIKYWHMAMTGCIKSRNVDDAEQLFQLLRDQKRATKTSYQILIASHLYKKDQASASRIFSYMLQDQVTADDATYEIFINYYMNQQPFDQETSETVFKLWQAVNLTTTQQTLPLNMVEKYLSYFGKHGELAKAEQVYLGVVKKRQQRLNRQCLGQMNKIVIGFANKRQLPSALSLFYDLIGQGYKPSAQVILKVTEACKSMKDNEAIAQLHAIVQEQSKNDSNSQLAI